MKAIVAAVLWLAAGRAPTAPVATLRDLGPALTACFHAPAGSAGSRVTVRFSLTRQGTVFGEPRITFSKLTGSPDDRKAFVATALAALAACTPVALTPGLGGALAGRPISVTFVGGGRTEAI